MSKRPVNLLSVCLNPAWQKTLIFDAFAWGAVNRARILHETGGGKGVNLARALRCAGDRVTVALFSGGSTGALLERELAQHGIGCLAVPVAVPTRTCTTVADRQHGTTTELIEPSGEVSAAAAATMTETLCGQAGDFDGLALCGTYPPGVPEGLYATVAASARDRRVPVLLDGIRGVAPVLETGVDLLKINRAELCELTHEQSLGQAFRACFERYRPVWIAVTDGPHEAHLASRSAAFTFRLPDLGRVRNAIGAGDCASGVLLAETVRAARALGRIVPKLAPELMADAFADALAAASASCLTDLPAVYDPPRAAALRAAIACKQTDSI